MDEAYRPVVAQLQGIGALWQQSEQGLVKLAEATTSQLKELLEDVESLA